MAKPNYVLTAEKAREVLRYDGDSGKLYWRVPTGIRVKVGDEAGYLTKKGYRRLQIGDKSYASHRIVWLMEYGEYPRAQIDHINEDKSDNRLCNLREATNAENVVPRRRVRADNTSGHSGVTYVARDKRWVAQINIGGVQRVVGRFPDRESAVLCRVEAEKIHYPFKWAIA